MGAGHFIHKSQLHAQPDPYPRATLTKKQAFFFNIQESFTPLINQALLKVADTSILTEVKYLRVKQVWLNKKAIEMVKLQNEVHVVQWAINSSLR